MLEVHLWATFYVCLSGCVNFLLPYLICVILSRSSGFFFELANFLCVCVKIHLGFDFHLSQADQAAAKLPIVIHWWKRNAVLHISIWWTYFISMLSAMVIFLFIFCTMIAIEHVFIELTQRTNWQHWNNAHIEFNLFLLFLFLGCVRVHKMWYAYHHHHHHRTCNRYEGFFTTLIENGHRSIDARN